METESRSTAQALEVSSSGSYRWREGQAVNALPNRRGHQRAYQTDLRSSPGLRMTTDRVHAYLVEQAVRGGRDRTLHMLHELELMGNQQRRFKPMGTPRVSVGRGTLRRD